MEKTLRHTDFYSRAKLMLTGEYLVLKGADSLSLPLKLGQSLEVKISDGISSLQWKTYEKSRFWFEAHFSLPELAIGNTNDFLIAKNLRDILLAAKQLNPDFLSDGNHYEVTTNLEFQFKWGMGSSSSLIVNIANWAKVNPFKLNTIVSMGSGYDIASASSEGPIIYNIGKTEPIIKPVSFDPVFKDNLYFVYLGEKKNTESAIQKFKIADNQYSDEVKSISEITNTIFKTKNLSDFIQSMEEHERIISGILQVAAIKKKRFIDFNGFVKSLGAWGGDFALFMSDYPKDYITSYLKRKNLNTWFHFKDIIGTSNIYSNV